MHVRCTKADWPMGHLPRRIIKFNASPVDYDEFISYDAGQPSLHQVPAQTPKTPSLARRVSKLLAIVDPKRKAALVAADFIRTQSAAAVVEPGARPTASTAEFFGRQRNPLAIVDPKSKAALPVFEPSSRLNDSMKPSSFAYQKPGRHAIAFVDPQTRKQVIKGKKLLAITDPTSKQAVQLPVKGLANSSLVSTSLSNAVCSRPERSVKRTIAIVDPHSKQPVMLPQAPLSSQQASAVSEVRGRSEQTTFDGDSKTKAIIAIIDPTTSPQVKLPDTKPSCRALSRSAQRFSVDRPKKVLTIVDPAPKASVHASHSAKPPVYKTAGVNLPQDHPH